jgi:hypothetical protein
MQNKLILETLQMQPLSQEEMTSRHILGRLYGPIATCVESTRNGRLYNKPLWEKALRDEIFLEKVATKALFLELGHPEDREETDMRQACACIPEVPKIVGDELYAQVDILDTPNGRLLKTLVDYGFVPGISSRGSGDVMDNNQVDPETFFLETWDIVQLPAVKKARLNVFESLDSTSIKLKKALAESYKAAKDEDKDTMKKALENLNIDIEEEISSEKELVETALSDAEIPWDEDEDDILLEASEDEVDIDVESDEEPTEETSEEEIEVENTDKETVEVEEASEENTEESEETGESAEVINDAEELDVNTVSEMKELFQELEDELGGEQKVEFEPVTINGEEHAIDKLHTFVDEEQDVLVIGVDCEGSEEATTEEDSEEVEELENADENIDDSELEELSAEDLEETEEDEESAEDDGDVEVIESLKEMIRQKEALETEVSNLRKAKTVGDAKEQELQEKLSRYQKALNQTKLEADKVKDLEAKVKELSEQLTQSKNTIKRLVEKADNTQQLKESADKQKARIKSLNESVTRLTEKSEALEAKLEGQTKQFNSKLQERTDLAKTYKARFIETLNRYVESKASMLGVKPSEITSRLNESYTLSDVDAVCDQILDTTVNFSRLPFGGRAKTSARIAESVTRPSAAAMSYDPANGYEIDDALLELAGLKK